MGQPATTTVRPLRLTAPGVALIALCYGIARFAYGLFVPAFRAEFTLSDTLLGVIGAGSYIGYCLAIIVAAAAVTRHGPRPVAAAAGIVATLGMALIAAASTPTMLALAVLLAGSSTGVASPPLAQALADWLPASAQTRAQSIVNAGPGLGIALSGPVALLAVGNWRVAWLSFALLGAAVTVWIVAAVPREGTRPPRDKTGPHPAGALVSPAAGRLAATATAFGLASACVWTFGRDHLTLAGDHTETTTILMWIILGIAGLTGAAGGDLITRHGLPAMWRSGLATLAASTAVIGVLPSQPIAAGIAMAAFGAAYMILTIVVFFSALRLQPTHPATTVGLGFLMITVGQALGAPMAGLLIEHVGATATFLAFTLIGTVAMMTSPTRPSPVR